MKLASTIFALIGCCCLAFAWWGMNTSAGRSRFDEMDGLYPFFTGIAGGVLLILALVIAAIALWKGGH